MSAKLPLKRKSPLKRSLKPSLQSKRRSQTKTPQWFQIHSSILWTAYIKKPQRCFFSGVEDLGECAGIFNACHLIPRSRSKRLKFHPSNGICSCVKHHYILDGKAAGTPLAWRHIEKIYPGRYEELLRLSRDIYPMKVYDWQEVYETILFEASR